MSAEHYDRAQAVFGAGGAAFELPDPPRCLVGWWRRVEVGEAPEAKGGPILRSSVWCFVVAGQGATWADAWEAVACGGFLAGSKEVGQPGNVSQLLAEAAADGPT
jgi:hypothetical protein